MNKIIFRAITLGFLLVWAIRYYNLNNGFAIKNYKPVKNYSMHETVEFGDNASYNVIHNTGYSVSVEDARIIDADALLTEINKDRKFFNSLAERYLIVTMTVSNNGDYEGSLDFYSIPVIGIDWYVFYSSEITACLNPFFNDNASIAHGCTVKKGTSATVTIAYNLHKNLFAPNQWKNLKNQDLWLWVTAQPLDQRIKINL